MIVLMPGTNRGAFFASVALICMPLLSGCSGAADLLSRDAEWFSRPTRIFGNDLSVGAQPLTSQKAVSPEDLVSAEGACSGMALAVQDPNVPPQPGQPAATPAPGGITLDATECDVVRFAGMPDQTEVSANERNDRVTTLTYLRGSRPGIYRFTAGRLTSVDRAPEPPQPQRRAPPSKSRRT